MSVSMSDQLQALKFPAPTPPPVTRLQAAQAAIAAVPVTRRGVRSLNRFRLDLEPVQTSRERTTWRRVTAATSALLTKDFPYYNEALDYSRSIGGHKPLRMELGRYWRVVSPNLTPTIAEWVNVGSWHPPFRSYCDPSSIADTLDSIPDFSEA